MSLDEADTLAPDDVDTESDVEPSEATHDTTDPVADAGTGSADAAMTQGSEQDTPGAGEAEPKQVDWEKRFKDLQSYNTRISQELSALKKNAKPEAPPAVESEFSEEKFDEIADKEGRSKALRYMHDCAVRAAATAAATEVAAREANAKRVQEITGILSEFGDSEEIRQSLVQLGEREASNGFTLSPGALYALNEARGDQREMIRLIRAGKKALAGETETAPAKPAAKPPPIPGGSAARSPSGNTVKATGKIALSALGFR